MNNTVEGICTYTDHDYYLITKEGKRYLISSVGLRDVYMKCQTFDVVGKWIRGEINTEINLGENIESALDGYVIDGTTRFISPF